MLKFDMALLDWSQTINSTGQYDARSAEKVNRANRDDIIPCITNPLCQPWFLEITFLHREDTDDELLLLIANHHATPMRCLHIIMSYAPQLLNDTNAAKRISIGHSNNVDLVYLTNDIEDIYRIYEQEYTHQVTYWRELSHQSCPDEIFVNRLPHFILKYYLVRHNNAPLLTRHLKFDILKDYVDGLMPTDIAVVMSRIDVPTEILDKYSKHQSPTVRYAIANNSNTPLSALTNLTADSTLRIRQAALNTLPQEIRNTIRIVPKAASKESNNWLELIRCVTCSQDVLIDVVDNAEPLLYCAATLHPSASAKVIERAGARNNIPYWAQIGIVLRSSQTAVLNNAVSSDHEDLWMAVSSNPSLSKELAIELISKTSHDRLLANIADLFLDDRAFLNSLLSRIDKKSSWRTRFKLALDLNTDSASLARIPSIRSWAQVPFGSRGQRYRVLERLVARHPNCPQEFYPFFSAYIPADLSHNPAYTLRILETGVAVEPEYYCDDLILDDLDSGDASELTTDIVLSNQLAPQDWLRRTISSRSVNPNRVRHFAISGDAAIHQRFLRNEKAVFSQYEYRALERFGSKKVKSMIKERCLICDEA